jgi:hypothetical protein
VEFELRAALAAPEKAVVAAAPGGTNATQTN